jgi:hypothetical protein
MPCAAFAWAAWINLIDFRFSPSRAVSRALNDVNKPKRLGTRQGDLLNELQSYYQKHFEQLHKVLIPDPTANLL